MTQGVKGIGWVSIRRFYGFGILGDERNGELCAYNYRGMYRVYAILRMYILRERNGVAWYCDGGSSLRCSVLCLFLDMLI